MAENQGIPLQRFVQHDPFPQPFLTPVKFGQAICVTPSFASIFAARTKASFASAQSDRSQPSHLPTV